MNKYVLPLAAGAAAIFGAAYFAGEFEGVLYDHPFEADLRLTLVDPNYEISNVVKDQRPGPPHIYCFMLNAKNKFGGYTGFESMSAVNQAKRADGKWAFYKESTFTGSAFAAKKDLFCSD